MSVTVEHLITTKHLLILLVIVWVHSGGRKKLRMLWERFHVM
jgi:hypothetical protein